MHYKIQIQCIAMLEHKTSHKTLCKGMFLEFVEDIVKIDLDPPIQAKRQYFVHPGGVCIVPVLENGDIVLIKQFRTPVGEIIYEFPAGKMDKGETPIETAKRELMEETGYSGQEWIKLGETYPCPGYSTETLHMFIAKNLQAGKCSPEEGELVETVIMTLDEAVKKVCQNQIKDSKTINGIFYLLKGN